MFECTKTKMGRGWVNRGGGSRTPLCHAPGFGFYGSSSSSSFNEDAMYSMISFFLTVYAVGMIS